MKIGMENNSIINVEAISVLIPTLGNREMELERLLKSLCRQKYKNLEAIVISQDNHEMVNIICSHYPQLEIRHLSLLEKGLSKARNAGLAIAKGDIILLSDDDCWYADGALENIACHFVEDKKINILLTQIYDPESKEYYKKYSDVKKEIKSWRQLFSKSSIEIAFRKKSVNLLFDEHFGLGAQYIACEEVDFLIRSFRKKDKIVYIPEVTVYHKRKPSNDSDNQIYAKGAFYSKNFGYFVANIVLLKDLFLVHQNNYRWFWSGFNEYRKNKSLGKGIS